MRAKFISLLLLIPPFISFAQLNTYNQPFNIIMVGAGMQQTFIANPAFNAWTQVNYHRTIISRPAFVGEVEVISKRFDAGIHFTGAYPFGVSGAYIGERLTRRHSPFASFLNLEAGGFFGHYKNIPPVNYTPTPDQEGQDLWLHYNAFYVGLSSRTYFNKLHFRIGSKNKGVSVNSGFFVTAGCVPFGGRWEYGYTAPDNNPDDEGNGSYFNGVKIKTIPYMSSVFVNAGLIIGVSN